MEDDRPSYTLDQARALLPQLRATLLQLAVERRRYAEAQAALRERAAGNGSPDRDARLRRGDETLAEIRDGMAGLLTHLERLGVELRDVEEGLVDIPTLRDGEPAWFCWRLADPDLGFWHTTREGFSGRRPI